MISRSLLKSFVGTALMCSGASAELTTPDSYGWSRGDESSAYFEWDFFFTTFGESSLDFELAVWTSEMAQSPRRFISNINFAIDQKFREHDIEIPFPQRDLHVRSGGIEIKKAADSEESAAG